MDDPSTQPADQPAEAAQSRAVGDGRAGSGGSCADVELSFDEESGVLTASVVPGNQAVDLDADSLRARVEAAGFDDFNFKAEALSMLARCVVDRRYGDYAIATRVDAEVSILITADRLRALLSTTRAYGGRPVSEERITRAVSEAGIPQELCLPEVIADAAGQATVTNLVIAKGVAPRSGQDSRFELLVDLGSEVYRPRENEHGEVDHYLQRDFVIVEEETPLLRYYPATRGIPGRDVTGRALPAKDGRVVPLPRDVPGVRPHPEDENLLIADYKGHPVATPGGVRVDKTLVLDYVDLRTGNVEFDGSVVVKGDVSAGVLIRASGNVNVMGTVENSSVEAGGDIHVAQGMTGSESAMRGGAHTAHIEAEHDVRAAYAGGIRISAGNDVVVKEYLSHCETLAAGQVLVGQEGGRGLIVGGSCHGCRGVAGRVAGTRATVPTLVSAGVHEELLQRYQQALADGDELADKLGQLRDALEDMVERARGGEEPQTSVGKVRRTVTEYERRVRDNQSRIDGLQRELDAAQDAVVELSGPVCAGVTISIAEASVTFRNEAPGGRFSGVDGEIGCDSSR